MSPHPSELLPGANGPGATPPRSLYKPHDQLKQARRQAWTSDVIDTAILLAVDVMFLTWPVTHIPFLSRHASLLILFGANVLLGGYWVRTRYIPRWKARRIAATWNDEERAKFSKRK